VIALDTNVLVRFVTRDDPAQARQADRLLAREGETFLLLDAVLIELHWTLRRLYAFTVEQIGEVLAAFESRADIEFENRERVARALTLIRKGHDFADILIAERAREIGCSAFATFDERLAKLDPGFFIKPGSARA